jgi:hypothetical protein
LRFDLKELLIELPVVNAKHSIFSYNQQPLFS